MGTTQTELENKIKTWLQVILDDEKLQNVSVKICGNTQIGDGHVGDVIFVTASGITNNTTVKDLDLVLKCSKSSEVLRKTQPIKEHFLSEIFTYEQLFPCLIQFQKNKGIKNCFDNFARCYGSVLEENKEIVVLENLKIKGFELWPKRNPLTRKHIDLVVTQYAKLHATSIALEHQKPEEFQKLLDGSKNVWKELMKLPSMIALFAAAIDKVYDLLKNEFDPDTMSKWKHLKSKIDFVFKDMLENLDGLKTFLHGDCWNNNFMFVHDNGTPVKVVLLDFQLSRYSSPILDLSYFLFACASGKDIDHFNDILDTYYKTFVNHSKQLGLENPEDIYPQNQFLADWKNYSIYGIILASLIMKLVSAEADEILDLGEAVENGKAFGEAFMYEIRDEENLKNRIRPIVKYAVEHGLI